MCLMKFYIFLHRIPNPPQNCNYKYWIYKYCKFYFPIFRGFLFGLLVFINIIIDTNRIHLFPSRGVFSKNGKFYRFSNRHNLLILSIAKKFDTETYRSRLRKHLYFYWINRSISSPL